MRDRPDGRRPGPGRLSVAALLACALAGMVIPVVPPALAQAPAVAAAPAPEFVVVDLRAAGTADREATRRELTAALARDERLHALPADPVLAAVLDGPAEAAERAALASLQAEIDHADALRQAGDCERAMQAAGTAIDGLAAEQVARAAEPGIALVAQALTAAHAHVLACAHQLGDTGRALATAQWLRALGHGDDAPPGVSAELWRAYPAVDALGNAAIVELEITTEPAGTPVWLDHVLAGVSPVTVLVGEGTHLVAAGGVERAAGQRVQVNQAALPRVGWGQPQVMTVHLALAPRPWAWQAEAAAVARWRDTGAVDGPAMAALLARVDARVAVVLVDADARLVRSGAPSTQAAQIWAVAPGADEARRVGAVQLASLDDAAERIAARVAAWAGAADGSSGRGPEPGQPLLRETDVPGRFGSRSGQRRLARQPWWAYATIIGAVAATSLLILGADLGDDRQRIELRWP